MAAIDTETMNQNESVRAPLPAVRTIAPELDKLARLGQWLAASESDRKDENTKGATAALRLYYCEQLQLPPWAVAEVNVIGGNLSIGAQLMRALAERAGYRIAREHSTETACTATLYVAATGQRLGEATFTIEDAARAGLANKHNWKTHPARMLWARASKNVINDFAPHVSLGIVLDDEAAEITGQAEEAFAGEHVEEYVGDVEEVDPDLERIPFGEPDPPAARGGDAA